jgi:uncharacterized membrane protein
VVCNGRTIGALALAMAALACRKSGADCIPPPAVLTCPEAGSPSFATDVLPKVFYPVCDDCHAPGKVESGHPLTDYQEIYGPTSGPSAASEANAIFTQVFENCSMPPSNAPMPFDDDERQILLDWFACGAPDSPPLDAGSGD